MKKTTAGCLLGIALAVASPTYALALTPTLGLHGPALRADSAGRHDFVRGANHAPAGTIDNPRPRTDVPEPSQVWLIVFIAAAFGGLWFSRRRYAPRAPRGRVKDDDRGR